MGKSLNHFDVCYFGVVIKRDTNPCPKCFLRFECLTTRVCNSQDEYLLAVKEYNAHKQP